MNLWPTPEGRLKVRVHPAWPAPKSEDEETLDHYAFARRVVSEMVRRYPELGAFVSRRPWRFVVADDDAGYESAHLLKDGLLVWSIILP